MVKTNKAQRRALHGLWTRAYVTDARKPVRTYRSFRKSITPCFDGSGCIMVPWCNMWVGIETDGYTHS